MENIALKPGKETAASRFHPWIFSGAINKAQRLREGTLVRVSDARSNFICWGYWGNASIAVRVLSRTDAEPGQAFWNERFAGALEYRQTLGFTDSEDSNCFRLIHGEGDGIPGLVCDYYDGVVVAQFHNEGIEHFRTEIQQALEHTLGRRLKNIVFRSTHERENGSQEGVIMENGIRYEIDFVKGQKTGFFLDQRLNRALLGSYARGKRVLNTFCYTGGFSLAALRGGASEVVSVDSSDFALQLLERNLELNGLKEAAHQSVSADAVQYMRSVSNDFDIIVLDPPAFAKSLKARHNAIQAYKRINLAALKAIKPGGLLFTFSCSQVVEYELFRSTVYSAALECGREIRIVHRLEQSPDHPVSIYHPEGEYLKGLVVHVL
ncbi:MAG: class I SAM-dependent rRNA methyltransferase [Flavobacteriales bacterium]